jgi:hypothetical protein
MTPRSGVGSEIIHTASLKILLEHIDGWTDSKSTCIAFGDRSLVVPLAGCRCPTVLARLLLGYRVCVDQHSRSNG